MKQFYIADRKKKKKNNQKTNKKNLARLTKVVPTKKYKQWPQKYTSSHDVISVSKENYIDELFRTGKCISTEKSKKRKKNIYDDLWLSIKTGQYY